MILIFNILMEDAKIVTDQQVDQYNISFLYRLALLHTLTLFSLSFSHGHKRSYLATVSILQILSDHQIPSRTIKQANNE
ncbi:hypothetical protein ES332_D04G138400v1 [Gossypium tomentosum]|uniref:Uncharacterized protein n=1 Tax=Gossypium tomentosum TaxID=34277 RepID=A0A5D2LDY0_GOSTO|nr:hypothetical protein ES332_D04G138400v1 [Gossypium tomentosum]